MTAPSSGDRAIARLPDGRPIEAVLFDLDGTLVDALSAWDAAFTSAFAIAMQTYPQLAALGEGAAVHRSVFRPLVAAEHRAAGSGHWDPQFLHRAFHALLAAHAEPNPPLAARLYSTYATTWPQHVRPYIEAASVIEALAGSVRLAIVSNGDGPEQRKKIAPLGLDAHFSVVCISGELGTRKPEPAIFEHALAALNVAPERTIHVGDDLEADVGGAHAAGLAAGVWVRRHGEASPSDAPTPAARMTSLEPLPTLLGL